jgi:hypothetical protein
MASSTIGTLWLMNAAFARPAGMRQRTQNGAPSSIITGDQRQRLLNSKATIPKFGLEMEPMDSMLSPADSEIGGMPHSSRRAHRVIGGPPRIKVLVFGGGWMQIWIACIMRCTEEPWATQYAASKTLNNEKATNHIVCHCVGVEPQCSDGMLESSRC